MNMEFLAGLLGYGVKYVISIVLAFAAVKCGIALRKRKNVKADTQD